MAGSGYWTEGWSESASGALNLAGRFSQLTDEWLDTAHSCAPCDRRLAEEAVRELYRQARQDWPQIIWVDSLTALQQAVVVLDHYDACRRPSEEWMYSPGGTRVRRAFHGGLLRPMADRPRLHGQFWLEPGQFTGDWPVSTELRFRVDAALQSLAVLEPRDQSFTQIARVGAELWWAAGFAPDATIVALSSVEQALGALLWQCYLELGAAQPLVAASLEVLRQVGWLVPLAGLAILVDRPTRLRFEDETGSSDRIRPEARWWDGSAASYRGGNPMPRDLWSKPLREVLADPNLERRRHYLDLLGWDDPAGVIKPLASAADPGNPGQVVLLFEWQTEGQRRRFVEVANASLDMDGSRRRYVIEVDPAIDDPIAGVAATFGLDADSYRQLQRSC